ncbi:MAG: cytochrome c [Arenicellales bacterium]
MKIKISLTILSCMVVSMMPVVSYAHSDAHGKATGIVKERMDSMSDMGKAMKAMAKIVKGKADFNLDVVRVSAQTLADHASTITEKFPDTDASRHNKESDALPAIWTSGDQFSELSTKLETAIAALQLAAKGDLDKRGLRMVFAKTGKACSACHDDFRKPKE